MTGNDQVPEDCPRPCNRRMRMDHPYDRVEDKTKANCICLYLYALFHNVSAICVTMMRCSQPDYYLTLGLPLSFCLASIYRCFPARSIQFCRGTIRSWRHMCALRLSPTGAHNLDLLCTHININCSNNVLSLIKGSTQLIDAEA